MILPRFTQKYTKYLRLITNLSTSNKLYFIYMRSLALYRPSRTLFRHDNPNTVTNQVLAAHLRETTPIGHRLLGCRQRRREVPGRSLVSTVLPVVISRCIGDCLYVATKMIGTGCRRRHTTIHTASFLLEDGFDVWQRKFVVALSAS
jgi:hypothetical protein